MSEFRPGRFEILPTVIKNLLIINALVFLAQNTMGEFLGNPRYIEDTFALHYWGSRLFKPHQLVTHLFMHGSFGHLFTNMFTLWMFGATLENIWGPKRFLIFYMVCGLGAALCHMGVLTYENVRLAHDAREFINNPTLTNFRILDDRFDLDAGNFAAEGIRTAFYAAPDNPGVIADARAFVSQFAQIYPNGATLGASGAVFGLLFAFGYLFPNNLIYLYFLFPLKAKYFIGIIILMELFSGIQNSAGDNVAHFAHLGGVIFSYILLKIWNKKNRSHFY
ncbi:Rhomboid family protein [Chitinophaga sp. YR627]|jgi:membrane associated rhomboid family serine protease|uniref:rhomboid family intramembrane serine protease n=1 Tax=Chitinophaga sp. YR627 TaxID=1881041 RepID=UPI0008E27D89|nr:rhomboid family intramembrane serine protease [Chitinophaga sp. YR627]SFN83981.1 Rhomboid family protein [Chitinophaga sp. YR627]